MSRKQKPKPRVPRRVAGLSHMVAGPGPSIECGGKVWRVGFNTQDAKGGLEELVRAHVLRNAIKNKRAIGGTEGQEIFDEAEKKILQGHYLAFEKGWQETLKSSAGTILYLLSLLREHHPDATEDDARKLLVQEREQSEAAILAVSPSFFSAMAVQNGVTKGDAAEVAASIARDLATAPQEPATATAS